MENTAQNKIEIDALFETGIGWIGITDSHATVSEIITECVAQGWENAQWFWHQTRGMVVLLKDAQNKTNAIDQEYSITPEEQAEWDAGWNEPEMVAFLAQQ